MSVQISYGSSRNLVSYDTMALYITMIHMKRSGVFFTSQIEHSTKPNAPLTWCRMANFDSTVANYNWMKCRKSTAFMIIIFEIVSDVRHSFHIASALINF